MRTILTSKRLMLKVIFHISTALEIRQRPRLMVMISLESCLMERFGCSQFLKSI